MSPDDLTQGAPGAPLSLGSAPRIILNLGVIDQPYRQGGMTTGGVAQILEEHYGLMEAFWRVHEQEVQAALSDSAAGAIETMMLNGPVSDPFARGCQVIQDLFVKFISSGEAERVGIPGTPTKAALRGVSHRRKHPYRRSNPRRVSFRDTGLYVGSARVWTSRG